MDTNDVRMRLGALRHSLLGALGLLGATGLGCGGKAVIDGGGGSGAGATSGAECPGAVPVPAKDGSYSGYRRCPDGTVHRSEAAPCDATVPGLACNGTEDVINCLSDADCVAGPHGRCVQHSDPWAGIVSCGCDYACASDAECASDEVCACAGVMPSGLEASRCVAASCHTGDDCASGECGISSFNDGCFTHVELACRAPGDACRLDAECASASEHCVLTSNGAGWHCEGPGCTIGRPLLVEGRALRAPAAARGDWGLEAGAAGALRAEDLAALARALEPADRARLAEHWLEVGALEHASIGSFARFTLELLAFGAPAALVADAQRAAEDEVEHARMAYAVASACSGQACGPGALELGALALAPSRAALVRALVLEACAGETLGVAEALELALRVAHPALRAVYLRLAADEERHAALGWRTLAWLLTEGGPALRGVAERAFAEATELYASEPARPDTRRPAPELGLLASAELAALRGRALREVVLPCARALSDQLSVISCQLSVGEQPAAAAAAVRVS
ncbi:MAG: ferritin-like domain-containing protein [Myxococcales bacterium]|nr:ferritin-like domain-containing protein [Myxococcales bacterium]